MVVGLYGLGRGLGSSALIFFVAVSLEQAMAEQREYPAVKAMAASQDYVEGPKAFSEKRAPKWTGK